MINFEKISWQQVLVLCKVINSSSSLDLKTVKRWYIAESINFEDTLELLSEVGIINMKDGKVLPNQQLRRMVGPDGELIRDFFIDVLFRKESNIADHFGDFFASFELDEGSYKFVPTTQERLKYSGVRNFLISLDVLQFESSSGGYLIKKELADYLFYKDKVMPYRQFEKRLKSERELGLAAELLVYKHEKGKFKNNPAVQRKIRHVSLHNVAAGYDVKSFEEHKKGKLKPKYIEVKAVSEDNWRFYWSKNEISKAMQFGKRYYLYLVPVRNGKRLNIAASQQIRNAYRVIFLNKKDWKREVETISFSKTLS